MTIESLGDTFKSGSDNSRINGSLAAVFSSVHKVDNRAIIDPRLSAIPTMRIADEEEITEKVNTLAELVGEEKFYLKVGGLLYQKGAEVGLRPDGIVSKTSEEKIEAERILKASIPETHIHKKHVINPTVGELVACMGQIDEFKQVRAQFITERLTQGATMAEADAESKEITPEVVKKAKELRTQKQAKKYKVLDKIEEKIPNAEDPEIRTRLIQDYLNEHGAEIIAEAERYTLEEIKTETELLGSVKSSRTAEFLRNYAEAEQTSEEFERVAEEGIRQVYTGIADTFNRLMIPGYEAWADGGSTTEVISSAGSDIVLTYTGGKLLKVAWKGSQALYQGAKALGKELFVGEQVIIRRTPRESELHVGRMLGTKARPQVSYIDGKEVPYGTKGSVRPDFIISNQAAFEVKNYNIETNSEGLIREVVRQVKERAIHLPEGMKQRVMIDVRGQSVSREAQAIIKQKIIEKSNSILHPNDIRFIER